MKHRGEHHQPTTSEVSRLLFLDDIRGIAVISVMLYHFLSRFPGHYPYGDQFLYIAKYGNLGVQAFFIVSGFVIALTLERTTSMKSFAMKRFIRLWPPILFCSTITFVTMHAIDTSFTAERRVGIVGFLPSLTLVGPEVWLRIVDGAVWIDGAYWSLFVEVRFYFWAALLFFLFKINYDLALFVFSLLGSVAINLMSDDFTVKLWNLLFISSYMPFFSFGIISYFLFTGRKKTWHWPAAISIILYCIIKSLLEHTTSHSLILIICFLPFLLCCTRPFLIKNLSLRPFRWVGRRSYSIYLVHQNIGVAIISLSPPGLSNWIYLLVIISVILFIISISEIIFRLIETRLYTRINEYLNN